MKVDLTLLENSYDLDFKEQGFYTELGSIIRNCRRAKNISQDYMAVKLKISQNAYSKIEAGKSKCSVYRLMKILMLLQMDLQTILNPDLFDWSDI